MAVSFRSVFSGLCLVGAEPVAVSRDGEHHASVEEPVQHRGGDGAVREDVSPGCDVAVGGEDDRAFLVSAGDDLEQSGGSDSSC